MAQWKQSKIYFSERGNIILIKHFLCVMWNIEYRIIKVWIWSNQRGRFCISVGVQSDISLTSLINHLGLFPPMREQVFAILWKKMRINSWQIAEMKLEAYWSEDQNFQDQNFGPKRVRSGTKYTESIAKMNWVHRNLGHPWGHFSVLDLKVIMFHQYTLSHNNWKMQCYNSKHSNKFEY